MRAPGEWDVVVLGPRPARAVRWWEDRCGFARALAACPDEPRAVAARRRGVPAVAEVPDEPLAPFALVFDATGDEGETALAAAPRLARDAIAVVHRDVPPAGTFAALERAGATPYAYAPLAGGRWGLAVAPLESRESDAWLHLFARLVAEPREPSAEELLARGRAVSLVKLLEAERGPVDRTDVTVAAVHPGGAVPLEAPGSVTGRRSGASGLRDGFVAEPVVVAELHQATVVMPEGSVFTARDELVLESSSRDSFAVHLAQRKPELARTLRRPPRSPDAAPVALLTHPRRPNYYHWWVDCLPRIWLLDERTGHRGCPLVTSARLNAYELESLELLGAADRVVPQAEPARAYRRLLLTPGLAWRDVPSPMLATFAGWVRDRMGVAEAGAGARLYAKRGNARRRRVLEEAEVAAALEPLGFEAVELDGMSVREQVERFAGAEAIVGGHGAGLTNMLFSPAGATVVELFSPFAFADTCYRHMAAVCGHPYHAVVGTPPPGSSGRAPARRSEAHDDDIAIDPGQVAAAVEAALERNLVTGTGLSRGDAPARPRHLARARLPWRRRRAG
jgi:capsular polysaccharide biosynthesis protein